jgi:methylated-DNA-[protein]-cysteine S-methyltransferase
MDKRVPKDQNDPFPRSRAAFMANMNALAACPAPFACTPGDHDMKPTDTQRLDSPLGPMILAATAEGLSGAWFEGQRHGPSDACMQNWTPNAANLFLQKAADQLQAYFAGQLTRFDVPLDLSAGTPFQQSVWQVLRTIPSSASQSYGDVAKQLNKPNAVRAVGAAVGRNPVSIIVPCHRILGASGQLTGYAGGLWRKQALLQLEGHPMALPSTVPLFPE